MFLMEIKDIIISSSVVEVTLFAAMVTINLNTERLELVSELRINKFSVYRKQ